MNAFGSFLNKDGTPSMSAASSNPLAAPPSASSISATLPTSTAQTQQSNASSIPAPSIPTTSSSLSTTSEASTATFRLREIAERTQKLNESIRAGSADLPKLELNLGMIRDKARDMSRRTGGVGRENLQQAYSYVFIVSHSVVTFYSPRRG